MTRRAPPGRRGRASALRLSTLPVSAVLASAVLASAVLASAVVVLGGARGPLAGASAAREDEGLPVTWAVAPAPLPGQPQRANFDLEASPGDSLSDGLVVENLGEVELVLGVEANDAFNTPSGGTDVLAVGEPSEGLGGWITVGERSVTLPPGGEVEVPFRVDVPEDAAAGDHSAGIVTTLSVAQPDENGNRVEVRRRLGTRIHLRVDGEMRPELAFSSLEVEYRGSANPFAPGSVVLTYRVENTGNVRLRATRTATVSPSIGPTRRSQAADMPELLPGNSYELTQEVRGVWPSFGVDAEVELVPYASEGAELGPSRRVAIARTSITQLPAAQLVAAVALAMLLLAALLWRRRTRLRSDRAVDRAAGRVPEGAPHDPGPPRPPPLPPHLSRRSRR